MEFKRNLKRKLIDKLNGLYEDRNSWWRKMVDDKDVFILIRNNRLHVLANGGLFLQVGVDSRGGLKCQTHEEFLSLRSEKNSYVQLTDNETAPIQRVEGLKGLAEHYPKVKRRIKLFSGREKQVVQDLALQFSQIIDLEIGLEGDKKEEASRKGAQRVDMAGISDNGELVFFEVKLFDNSEIRSKTKPKVVGQLKKYDRLLNKYRSQILEGYEEQFKMYSLLKGRFFKNRMPKTKRPELYSNVRLIVTDFDGSQKKFLLPDILKGVRKGMGWDEKIPDLIATGSHRNIRRELLFKGLK